MTKKLRMIMGIFTESIGLYFSNFDKFVKYLSFPVLGQILGLGMILIITYFYSANLPSLLQKYEKLNSFTSLILLTIVVLLPGLLIFTKAFWEYLVAYGSINSMYRNMKKSGKVYDFDAHKGVVTRRIATFIGIWFLYGIFTLVALFPPFWVFCGVIFVYAVLTFQLFSFEENLSPFMCIKGSAKLIKYHFTETFILLAMVALLTYVFIPQVVSTLFNHFGITSFVSRAFLPVISSFDLDSLMNIPLLKGFIPVITSEKIAVGITEVVLAQILIQYTLPLRSIMWSLYYDELKKSFEGSFSESSNLKSNFKKRASEKLMEESHKKFAKKKLDTNILRRATEKDD